MASLGGIYKQLGKDLHIKNIHAVPRIAKVVLNAGVGKQRESKDYLQAVVRDLAAITGQTPHQRLARKSISGFGVRSGNIVGYSVTLRGKYMSDFIQKFVHITLPRVRDFRGIPLKSLDGHGNLSIGLREQLPFPEIHMDKTDIIFGVEITIVTSTSDNALSEALFRAIGFPFRSEADEDELIVPQRNSGQERKKPDSFDKRTHRLQARDRGGVKPSKSKLEKK